VLCSCLVFTLSSGCADKAARVSLSPAPPTSEASVLRIAVLPMENLSGKEAPLADIRNAFIRSIAGQGVFVLSDDALDQFMTRHRMRYTGGLDSSTAQSIRTEERIDAVLILSIELYQEGDIPKIALISRLVSTGDTPTILWIKSVAIAGNDSPGLLRLGMIYDPVELRDKAIRILMASFEEYLSRKAAKQGQEETGLRFGPKAAFRAPEAGQEKSYTIAVVPFFNTGMRKDSGDILLLHFVEELNRQGNFRVVEPGLVRNSMLNARVIMNEGISLADADFILNTFNVDFVLSGKVIDYQDTISPDTPPSVDFLVWAIQRVTKKVFWASESYNAGNDAVFMFDFGKVTTAGKLASKMAAAVARRIAGEQDQLLPDLQVSPRQTAN